MKSRLGALPVRRRNNARIPRRFVLPWHCATAGSICVTTLAHALPNQDALEPAGIQAAHILRLWNLTLIVCAVFFAAVLAGVLVALLRRKWADVATPPDLSGNARPERGVRRTVVALVGLVVADALTDRALSQLPVARALHIELVGWDWWWQANYAPDGDSPGFATANELHIPVGRPIVVSLTAGDVIHSFWVPNLHGKKDLLPGIRSTVEFRADKPGIYRGQCAQFCGTEHALMALAVVADPPDRYAAWAAAQRANADDSADTLAQRGKQVFEQSACASCHTVRGTRAAGALAPDLTHLMSRQTIAAGRLVNDPANLAAWIRDPGAFKPGAMMPPANLSGPDLRALVAWLGTLR
ncbi:cytochrome c oxidase subunit 2 [Trinickia symbiotica]|uniref:cytochrome-c oxidase n=1 Tax=Trinickia symbiotica TaxID=863227 RepID=A0A2N7X039_9BURK|nr:cytochrome c oxidase subunit II [Trinickia symbiotica]PMS35106.1 cytochrome C oxidase subunit II [Trinickia symbiotica]PPK43621.1 cytochrome c oxidase subunit 2 [Trinickia symbiotica]